MWIVAIAWMYVAVMMALAEATSPQGSILGALITFVFYGVAPLALVMYLLGTPGRRKARLAAQAQEQEQEQAQQDKSAQADASSLAAGDAVAPERKEV
jgi:mannose/fructose/N-acetylgalactosamine-specific phosphotransferase system component IID